MRRGKYWHREAPLIVSPKGTLMLSFGDSVILDTVYESL